MRLFLALSLLVVISACGKKTESKGSPEVYRVDSSLQPYVDKFKVDALSLGKEVNIKYLIVEFKDLAAVGADKIGICYYPKSGKGAPIIQIDPEYWEKGTKTGTTALAPNLLEAAREFVMFHELGHCVMNYPHRDGPNGPDASNPTSVMNTYALSPRFYLGINTTKSPSPECEPSENYTCLINELFYPNKYLLVPNYSLASSWMESPEEAMSDHDDVIFFEDEEFETISTLE